MLMLVPACSIGIVAIFAAFFTSLSFRSPSPRKFYSFGPEPAVTDIAIGPDILHTGVKRFGMNVGGHNFYNSGQILKNLVFRNPGFEGETWRSYLHCKSVTANSCTDETQSNRWPNGFFDGARYELISGSAKGHIGHVRTSNAATGSHGFTISFADSPSGLAAGDFVFVTLDKPGDAQAGWWTNAQNGATLSTEFRDLPPGSPSHQALRMDASAPTQYASVSSFFDSTAGESFVQLRGRYTLRFRAKALTPVAKLGIRLQRDQPNSPETFLTKDVPLSSTWQTYTFDFVANEDGSAIGSVGLTFSIAQSSILLDDVELVPVAAPAQLSANPTAFRDEVVQTLRDLRPGILRFMDSGTSFGSTFDDLIAPPFARRRGGSQMSQDKVEDIPIGLEESLVLSQAVHAEPWFTLPGTTTPEEAAHAIEFLAGPATSTYGAKRAALGQTAPWTSIFPTIHLEYGNEMWNSTFAGSVITDPAVYAARANDVFAAARKSPWFRENSFDLIVDAQAVNTYLTKALLKTSTQQNSIDFAPYLFSEFNDASSTEAIFGSMFAEPEQWNTSGFMAQQIAAIRNAPHPTTPTIYEVNLGTVSSTTPSITQADIDRTVPSLGAGLAAIDEMLLSLRDLGIASQCFFALTGSGNRGGFPFDAPGNRNLTTPLWGAVIDMGGATNRRRPSFLALQLANRAVLPHELATHLSGANPTWSQPASANDALPATRAHLLQVFAFGDGTRRTLILLNLSRSASLPVTFSGADRPTKEVSESRLTAANITDSNEHQASVAIVKRTLNNFDPHQPYALPPFSMTVLDWPAKP
jgi:alpha-L-arabinofuranosidase